jgi:hypothetical protein
MDTAEEREDASFSRMWFALPVLLLVLAGRPPSAQETALAELTRTIARSRSGAFFTKKLTGVVTNARLKSLALVLDWWSGPGDDRVGDPAKAAKGGFASGSSMAPRGSRCLRRHATST